MAATYSQILEVKNNLQKEKIRDEFLQIFQVEQFPETREIEKSPQFKFLLDYIFFDPDGLEAKTIVIEKKYISLAYLSDYLNYYAHCYYPYKKYCKRIHFFADEISSEEFIKRILTPKSTEKEEEDQWSNYLGNIVIRPLPSGRIGSTLLSPYIKKKQKRYYTAIKAYPVNLFGKQLKINTLSYQEQDGVVTSCASSALWFAFQKTSEIFKSKSIHPSDITISAGYDAVTNKIFPSTGLHLSQIFKAITEIGLKSEVRGNYKFLNDRKWLSAFVYAYSRMGIPILLAIKMQNKESHLVTINGYRISENKQNAISESEKTSLNLLSDKILKFFAHDDQSGPFSRIEFNELEDSQNETEKLLLKTSLWENIEDEEKINASVYSVIVPITNEIKVTFEDMLKEVNTIDQILKAEYENFISWNIYIEESNKYKDYVRRKLAQTNNIIDEANDMLFKSLPRYIWVIQARDKNDNLLFDLLYDAIDINYKNSPYYYNIYSASFDKYLKLVNIAELLPVFQRRLDVDEHHHYFSNNRLTEEKDSLTRIVRNIFKKLKQEQPGQTVKFYMEQTRSRFFGPKENPL